MKKYIAIYFATEAQLAEWAKSTKEEQAEGMKEWNMWMETHKKEFADPGAPLGKTKRVSKDGITDTKNGICGYTIVEADSHEAAAKVFADSPHLHFSNTWIDVLELMEM